MKMMTVGEADNSKSNNIFWKISHTSWQSQHFTPFVTEAFILVGTGPARLNFTILTNLSKSLLHWFYLRKWLILWRRVFHVFTYDIVLKFDNTTRSLLASLTFTTVYNISSALSDRSSRFCPILICSNQTYYYETFSFNVTTSKKYIIRTISEIDTYGYIYNSTFDVTHPAHNLLFSDDEGWGNGQFGILTNLHPGIQYVIVATSFHPDVTGAFLLNIMAVG